MGRFSFFSFVRGGRFCFAVCAVAFALEAAARADEAFVVGDSEAGAAVFAQRCPVCHGVAGDSPIAPENPILAGLHSGYLRKQMRAYKSGVRENPIMNSMMAAIEESQIDDMAVFLAAQTPAPVETPAEQSASDREAARAIYAAGKPALGAPACVACHGAAARGIGREFPRLAGQSEAYLAAQLRRFRSGARENAIMNAVAELLEESEIDILAAYLARL